MTTAEFCISTGLTPREVQNWLDIGLLEPAAMVDRTDGGGQRREFSDGQVERARLLKALQAKGAKLGQLARANIKLVAGQAYVVFDGHELRTCRDAAAAIAAVVHAKRPCSAVDLTAIRAITE
jgi:DNA-binding transcriptional MerR regulator